MSERLREREIVCQGGRREMERGGEPEEGETAVVDSYQCLRVLRRHLSHSGNPGRLALDVAPLMFAEPDPCDSL